jgi:hypothetical protein
MIRFSILLILMFFLDGCSKDIDMKMFVVTLPHTWRCELPSDNCYKLLRDSVYIDFCFFIDSLDHNQHLKSQIEYLKTTDANVLSKFHFHKDNVIYVNKNNSDFIRNTNDTTIGIKTELYPILNKFVFVQDSLIDSNNFNYLGEFVLDDKSHWLPIFLPYYFKDFTFKIDSSKNIYRKLYYPSKGKLGKCGLYYHNYSNNFSIYAKSGIMHGNDERLKEILDIFESISIKN